MTATTNSNVSGNLSLTGEQVAAGAMGVVGANAYGDPIPALPTKINGARDVAYAAWPGVTIDDLSTTTGWSLTQTNGTITNDTITLPDGSTLAAVKFASNGAGAPNLLMTKSVTVNYDQSTVMGMWLYVDDPGIIANLGLLVSNETGGVFTNWKLGGFGSSGGVVFGKKLYWLSVPISAFAVGGGTFATAGQILSVRLRVINAYQNRAGFIKCSRLMVAPMARPKVCITFDDAYATQYSEAFRYMAAKGMRGTIAVTTGLVGTANYCTWAQLDAMYAAGWDMVCHSVAHTGFNSSSTNSIALSQTPLGAGSLTLNGSIGTAVFDAPRHVVIRAPDQGRQFTITGLDATGGALVESVQAWASSFAVPSQSLFSQVTSITTDGASTGAMTVGTSLSAAEMTAQLTGSQTALLARGYTRSAYDYVYPSGETNTTSEGLLVSLGFRSARIVSGQHSAPQVGAFQRYWLSGDGGGGAALTGTAMNALRASIIAEGRTGTIYLHELIQTGSPTSTQTLVSEFKTFIDGCVTDAAAGLCEYITQSEFPIA